jgi:hypothetical protein
MQPNKKISISTLPGNFNLTAHLDIPLSSAKYSQARLLPDTVSFGLQAADTECSTFARCFNLFPW